VGTAAALVGLLMSAVTALALVETDEWWIRVLDFPRLQIAAVLIAALFLYMWSGPRGTKALVVVALHTVALTWQVWMILPYTPLWPHQMNTAGACAAERRVRFLMANVFQENRNSQLLLQIAKDTNPDVILLTEIDEWWAREVAELTASHPLAVLKPLSNTYGIGLYSRLPITDGRVRYILDEDVPSVIARLTLTSGDEFLFWGVHPSPPRPRVDTDQRDAELLIVAKEAAEATAPAIVAGDLNDVAWSSTSALFQKISALLDPRVGRGLYASFNADWPLMKWPLDHLFASKDWTLSEFQRLDDIGSDHFPILVGLCLQPQADAQQEGHQPEPEDVEEAQEHIEEGKEAVDE